MVGDGQRCSRPSDAAGRTIARMVAHDVDVKRRSCSGRARALAAHVMLAPPCVLQWWPPAGRRSGESPAMS
ncbi:hypothetical protein F511_46176 [Dorcoceras hygrometricum]|uniref:Uncharacterized protein n=1 Tax=Dorcoceras hygrometricum TaxID=472368 RepID=A0A2Z7A150_9LAMI|nr:hypothetical protein F511_46176 [Dorcoceras hygrometricum]